jgi:L-threonylcarbamoyladenylate synthase
LILVAANSERFDFLLEDLPEIWLARLGGSWPGPNTWLMPHQNRLPEWIGGQSSSVALRVSDHAQVRALSANWAAGFNVGQPSRSPLRAQSFAC